MKKTPKIILLFCILSFNLSSQNLVENGDFELFKKCPLGQNYDKGKTVIKNWFIPNSSTPDYYNSCCKGRLGSVPINARGNQNAYSGNGYCGILLFYKTQFDIGSEYISTKLIKKLVKDKFYCVKFYVSLADKSDYFTNDIGVYFSKKFRKCGFSKFTEAQFMTSLEYDIYSIDNKVYPVQPQVKSQWFIDNAEDWIEISGVFKAQGGEQYLTIGSFEEIPIFYKSKNYNSRSSYYKNGNFVYYYIDNVSVIEITSPENCICKNTGKQIEQISNNQENDTAIILKEIAIGENIVLKNIYYAFNDSTLLESSYLVLNRLFNALNKNESLEIEIIGHTDNIGTDYYNQQLSIGRARAVVHYLTERGIKTERLSYKGFGASQPITSNETEEGRTVNRRVEFQIIKK